MKPIQDLYDQINNAMPHLEGWCTLQKACHLGELVLQQNAEIVVEIGVYGGRSLIPMALACKFQDKGKVIGIDPWSIEPCLEGNNAKENNEWWSNQNLQITYDRLLHKIESFGLEKWIELRRMTSQEAYEKILKESGKTTPFIDVLSIDGNHSEEASTYDVKNWVPLVKSGGNVVLDDIDWETTSKAQQMVKESAQNVVQTKTYGVFKKN